MNRYKKTYSIIDNLTPLDEDCGNLCSRACCKSDENRGMLLFPGEEELFPEKNDTWYKLQDSQIILSNNETIKLLTCMSSCIREQRPLACRIFPFMPYITGEGILELRLDPKSVNTCPLAHEPDKYTVQEEFIDALYDSFELLITYEDVIEFINILSEDYDKIAELI